MQGSASGSLPSRRPPFSGVVGGLRGLHSTSEKGYFDAGFEVHPRRGCIVQYSLVGPICRSLGRKVGWLDDVSSEVLSFRHRCVERTKPRLAYCFVDAGGKG